MTLAAQALTAQAATGGRLTLGIGPSHQPLVEGSLGYRWDRPARHVREYLELLDPLLRGDAVDVHGPTVTAVGSIAAPEAAPPPVLLAAHGPVLLKLAGELADGVITTWTGPRGLAEHVVPAVTKAARGIPQVVVGVVASLTADPDGTCAYVGETFALAGGLPSYRASLDRDGYAGPGDTVVAGDERTIEHSLRRFADAGATEFQLCLVGPVEDRARTLAFFGDLARRGW